MADTRVVVQEGMTSTRRYQGRSGLANSDTVGVVPDYEKSKDPELYRDVSLVVDSHMMSASATARLCRMTGRGKRRRHAP